MSYFSTHNHSHYSNIKLLDAIARPKELVNYAHDLGLSGICISEHAVMSSHIEFLQAYQDLKKTGNMREEFKIGLGVEAYLCIEPTLEELKEKATKRETKFYHFLMIALNKEGHEQLRILSSKSWENSFMLYGMQRTPNLMQEVESVVKQGDVVASSACLGGYIPSMLLKIHNSESLEEKAEFKKQLDYFTDWCIKVFGKDYFFLELQPSSNSEQIIVNQMLVEYAKEKGLNTTIATDSHYLKEEDREIHKIYLQSQDGGDSREVDAFYSSTFLMSEELAATFLKSHLSEEDIENGFKGTMKIHEMMEVYELKTPTIVPLPVIPEYKFEHLLSNGYEKYPYIKNYAYSPHDVDRYYLHLIQEGLFDKIVNGRGVDSKEFHVYLDRINTELRELWEISQDMKQCISAYYVLTREVVDVIWNEGDSIVGVARGSAAGFLTNYLIDITQVNPLDYGLPHFRHMNSSRVELPDIDLDSENTKRDRILQALKDKYSHKRVLNIATFMTEKSRSVLLSVSRGMGIDNDEVSYLTGLIPVERGFNWSLSDCYFGNEDKKRKPVTELVNAVKKYDGLMEASLKLEGVIKGCSVHASGIYIFNDDYTKQNAMMKSSSGQEITQFSMKHSDAMGALKIDSLTVKAIDRIRIAMDFLIELGLIEDKGDLRSTYNAYLHPDRLVYDDLNMWQKVANNEIPDLFQFDTDVGLQCAKKAKPTSIPEMTNINNLMRLMAEGEEQPVDKYVRFKNDINEWYQEMRDYGLGEEEIEFMKNLLGEHNGLISSQEKMMELLLQEDVANFTLTEADEARKIVGKKLMDKVPYLKDKFLKKGLEINE